MIDEAVTAGQAVQKNRLRSVLYVVSLATATSVNRKGSIID